MMAATPTTDPPDYNHFPRQYIPEDNSEHHTRRCENLKSHREQDGYVSNNYDALDLLLRLDSQFVDDRI
jgi:hypothetical protein